MKIEKIFCDDCGAEIINGITRYSGYDLCEKCVKIRIGHSISQHPVGKKCSVCNGSKGKKDFYGYHNEYNIIPCTNCDGTGYEPFTVD